MEIKYLAAVGLAVLFLGLLMFQSTHATDSVSEKTSEINEIKTASCQSCCGGNCNNNCCNNGICNKVTEAGGSSCGC